MLDVIINVFNIVLYQPLFNILVFFYNFLPGHDLGVAIIVLTVIIRLILYPVSLQAIKSQKSLNYIQPKIKEIQNKYKNEKEKQAQAIMELYKKEKVNPFGGCLPILIQLPILIALFRVLKKGLEPSQFSSLYSFIASPQYISPSFLGLINLTQASVSVALLAGILQFIQTKMITPKAEKVKNKQKSDFTRIMQKQMFYFSPILTFFILLRLPSAIGLYWIVNSLFGIGQQYLLLKKQPQNND